MRICFAQLTTWVPAEGYQFYTLPLSERPKVRELIGARGELAVFCKQLLLSAFSKSLSKTLLCADNCVMDRWSLDQLAIKVAKEMDAVSFGDDGALGDGYFFGDLYGGDAVAEAAAADRYVGTLRARPNAKSGMTGDEIFELTLRQLQDLMLLHFADSLDEPEVNVPRGGQVPFRMDGVAGRWYWEPYAQASVRPEFKAAVLKICAQSKPVYCPAFAAAHRGYMEMMPEGTPAAVWVPLEEGGEAPQPRL